MAQVALLQAHAVCAPVASLFAHRGTWKALRDPASGRDTLTCDALQVLQVTCHGSQVGQQVLQACSDQRKAYGAGATVLAAFVHALCRESLDAMRRFGLTPRQLAQAFDGAADSVLEDIDQHGRALAPAAALRVADDDAVQAVVDKVLANYAHEPPSAWDLGAVIVHCIQAVVCAQTLHAEVLPGVLVSLRESSAAEAARRLLRTGGSLAAGGLVLVRNSVTAAASSLGASRSNPGLARPVELLRVADLGSTRGTQRDWRAGLAKRLASCRLVLCTGSVDARLQCECAERQGVLLVGRVTMRELEAASRAFGVPIAADVAQALQICELAPPRDVTLDVLPVGVQAASSEASHALLQVRATGGGTFLQPPTSVLLAAPLAVQLEAAERHVWSALFRARNARRAGRVLGAGVEASLAQGLRRRPPSSAEVEYGVEAFCLALDSLGTNGVAEDPLTKSAWIGAGARLLHRLLHL